MNEQEIDSGAVQEGAIAQEGATSEPTTDEVAKMYEELGIKASAPTGKPKGRPKATAVRAKDDAKKDDGDSDKGQKADDSKGKSKDASDADKDGDSGDENRAKKSQKRQSDGKVSDESEETDEGVRETKSKSDKDSQRGSEGDSDESDDRDGQDDAEQSKGEGQESDDEEDGEDSEASGKRPGKSDPKIERRFQKMTTDIREREQRIEELERQLRETTKQHQEAQIQQEDPEYSIEDFHKVRDEDGNVIDLDPERAELAWRRWKDGFEQRKSEREAAEQHELAQQQRQQEMSENMMRSSAEAYDTLTGLIDEYPELSRDSGQYDAELASMIMPIINDTIIYQPGTEPGNEEQLQPVIVGMKMNPKQILSVISKVRESKRSLPLNGTNDNVDVRSNVSVQHGRSSDPSVNEANNLYKELGIDKRF